MEIKKTGSIREYYAYKYLESLHPDATLEYGHTSQKGWDIKVDDIFVQVKTVSEYSKTRTISTIHKEEWDELHLLYLNKSLYPEGFWIIKKSNIEGMFGDKEKLLGKRYPQPNNPNTGSYLPFGDNKIKDLWGKIPQQSEK
ncbi:hypothetical protein SPBRAN_1100 [uncultured Candidatus Thioglobus sp.]|nr:hypothetical protein SPBRAN_1100 [uncultured Candidatus Thioglobus sp.]